MNWVGKELLLANLLGMCTGVAVAFPAAGAGAWGVLYFGGFLGALGGWLIGAVAVVGGWYAQVTARSWPPRSVTRWRHRFALCNAATVALVWASLLGWAMSTRPTYSSDTRWTPWLFFTVVVLVTYVLAYLLSPAQPRETLTPAADPTAPTTPPTTAVASGSATHRETGSRSSGTGDKSQKPAPLNVAGTSDGKSGPGSSPSESET